MKNVKFISLIYLLLCGIILWYLYESIIFSKEIIDGVSECVFRIVNVVFPSLFGYMVMCEILVKSGLVCIFSKLLKPVSKYIFRLPEKLFTVYILSCIGGYPIGVKMLSTLVSDNVISKETAYRLSPFFYCVSPSFAVGIVGIGVFSNVKIGLIVYISCFLTNTILLLLYSQTQKFKSEKTNEKIKIDMEILVDSVVSSGKSMLKISFMIVFFRYFLVLLDCLKFFDIISINNVPIYLKSVLEITCINALNADLNCLPIVTGLVSCGGLCILSQLFCIVDNEFSIKRLILSRLLFSLMSSLVCYLIIRHFSVDLEVISYAISHKKSSDFNFLSLICLFFMIILIFFRKKNCNLKKSML